MLILVPVSENDECQKALSRRLCQLLPGNEVRAISGPGFTIRDVSLHTDHVIWYHYLSYETKKRHVNFFGYYADLPHDLLEINVDWSARKERNRCQGAFARDETGLWLVHGGGVTIGLLGNRKKDFHVWFDEHYPGVWGKAKWDKPGLAERWPLVVGYVLGNTFLDELKTHVARVDQFKSDFNAGRL